MNKNIQIKASMNQFKRATKLPNAHVKFAMDPNNALIWYALLHSFPGEHDEFAGGEYIVRLEATDKFPHGPPWFYFMTPNGVYEPGKKVCVDIGGYHSDNFRAVLGMDGFALQLVSGFIGGIDHGIGITHVSTEVKAKLAADSRIYNMTHHPEIVQLVDNTYSEYSALWLTPEPKLVEEKSPE